MKNKFLYILFAVLAFSFISCSNLIEPPEVNSEYIDSGKLQLENIDTDSLSFEYDDIEITGSVAKVHISMGNIKSRTMKPVFSNNDFVKLELLADKRMPDGTYSDNLSPVGTGYWNNDGTKTCMEKLCAEEFILLEGVYKFYLYAYTNEYGYVFRGITEKNLVTTETNEISFTLKAVGSNLTPNVTSENWGHLNLKFYIPDNIQRVTAGMFYGTDNLLEKFGEPVIVGDDDENHIYSDQDSYYYEQIELEIKNDNDGKGKYVIYSDTLEEYLRINNGKSGLPNGTYGIWVRGFLVPEDDPSLLGWDFDSWATEYRELIWIANGKTTTAERTIQGKYDGFAYFDVDGTLPGLTIPCGYTNGTPLDENLIPVEYRPKGLSFSGWDEIVYNQTTGNYDFIPVPAGTVLDATTMGKQYYAAYVFTMTIPKFKGNDGLEDTIIKTWDYYTDLNFMPYIMDYPNEEDCTWEGTGLSFNDYLDSDHLTASFCVDGDDMRQNTDSHLIAFFSDCADVDTQTQKANNDITDLVGTDELWASYYTINDSSYVFKHARSAVKFNFTGLPTNKKIRTMALYVPGDYIPFYAGMPIFNSDGSFYCEPELPSDNHAIDNHFYLTLSEDEVDFYSGNLVNPITEGFYPAADGSMTLYSMFYPKDFTGKTVICTLIDENEDYYVAYLDGKNLQAGNIYQYNAAPQKIAKEVKFTSLVPGKNIIVNTLNYGAYSPEDPGYYVNFANSTLTSIGSNYWTPFTNTSSLTTRTWGTSNSVNGFYFNGAGENGSTVSVFIPAAGYKNVIANPNNYNPVIDYGTSMNLWTGESNGQQGYEIYGSQVQNKDGVLQSVNKVNLYNVRKIRIEDSNVLSLTITNEPTKKEYEVGASEIDLAGLTVIANYENGSTLDVTQNVTTSGFNSSVENDSLEITVAYNGKTSKFNIKIKKPEGKRYSLQFNLPAGATITGSNPMEYVYNTTFVEPTVTYSSTIAGWYFESTCTTKVTTSSLKTYIDTYNPTSTITLYPYIPVSYPVPEPEYGGIANGNVSEGLFINQLGLTDDFSLYVSLYQSTLSRRSCWSGLGDPELNGVYELVLDVQGLDYYLDLEGETLEDNYIHDENYRDGKIVIPINSNVDFYRNVAANLSSANSDFIMFLNLDEVPAGRWKPDEPTHTFVIGNIRGIELSGTGVVAAYSRVFRNLCEAFDMASWYFEDDDDHPVPITLTVSLYCLRNVKNQSLDSPILLDQITIPLELLEDNFYSRAVEYDFPCIEPKMVKIDSFNGTIVDQFGKDWSNFGHPDDLTGVQATENLYVGASNPDLFMLRHELSDCYSPKALDLSDTQLTTIPENAFYSCRGLKSVSLPSTVTKIEPFAFCGCDGLETITIPKSVTEIDSQAFWKCASLTTVYYEGSQEDWNKITINDYGIDMCSLNGNVEGNINGNKPLKDANFIFNSSN